MSESWQPPKPDPINDQLRQASPEQVADILAGEEVSSNEGLQQGELAPGQGIRFGRYQVLSPFRSLMERARLATTAAIQQDTLQPDDTTEPGILDPIALALLSRRDGLKKGGAAGVGLALLLAGIGIGRASSEGSGRDPVTEMRLALQERFNVRFTTEYGATWTLQTLTILAQVLDVLPRHWFRPPSGEVMEMVAINIENAPSSVIQDNAFPDTALPEYKTTLFVVDEADRLSSYASEGDDAEDFIPKIARVAIPRIPIDGKTGISPWFHAVDSALEMPFVQFAMQQFVPSIREKYVPVLRKVEEGIARDRQEEYRATFAIDLLYALLEPSAPPKDDGPHTRMHPNIFLSTLALHFMRGKEYFVDMYTEMFGEAVAKRLYDFAHQDIFKSTTYDTYPLVSSNPYFRGPTMLMPSFQLQTFGL